MTINVAQAKAKLSSLLSFVEVDRSEVIISKRDKPIAVLLSYQEFLKLKKRTNKVDIHNLPSKIDKYVGLLKNEELDMDYKDSRALYLKEKHG